MQAAPLIQGITPPKPLDTTANIAENWKQFKQIWENYAIITNLTAQTEQYRVALFLHCLGPDAMKIYNGMQFASETDRYTLSKIVEKFDEFTIGEVNETYEVNAIFLTDEIRAKTNLSMLTLLRYVL